MTGAEEIQATERWMDLRKRLAKKLVDTMQRIVVDLEAGHQMDSFTFDSVMKISDYCDKILLTAKDPN